MKCKFELHDSRKERPKKSCDVLAFICRKSYIDENNILVSNAVSVHYSKKNDAFNSYDFWEFDEKKFVEGNGDYILYAYFNEAINSFGGKDVCEK